MLERRSNIEMFAAAEVPGFSNVRLVVDGQGAADWFKRSSNEF